MSGLARQCNEWHQPAFRAEVFPVKYALRSLLGRRFGPARERGIYHLAGPTLRGHGAVKNRFCHVAEHKPAILLNIHQRLVLAKGRAGGVSLHCQAPLSVTGNVTEDRLQMRNRQLLATELLAEAKAWAAELTAMEIQGPDDLLPAWSRLETRYGIPTSTFHSLRYRKDLKDIWSSLYVMLRLAVEAERSRRARKLSIKQNINAISGGNDEASSDARSPRADSEVRRV